MIHRLFSTGFLLTVLTFTGAHAQPPQDPGRPPTDVTVVNTPLAVSTGSAYKFVGFSSEPTATGGIGFAAMNAACLPDFGPDARMCTTKEVVQTPNLQQILATADDGVSAGWTHPVIVSEVFNPTIGTGGAQIIRDFSDFRWIGQQPKPIPDISCFRWTNADPTNNGTVVIVDQSPTNPPGTISNASCNATSIPVACCAPL